MRRRKRQRCSNTHQSIEAVWPDSSASRVSNTVLDAASEAGPPFTFSLSLMRPTLILSTLVLFFGFGRTSHCAQIDSLIAKTDSVTRIIDDTLLQDSTQASSDVMVPFRSELVQAAHRHQVPAALLAGVVQEESRFEQYAERTEPAYLKNPKIRRLARTWSKRHGGIPTSLTEQTDRARSYGLMQVMGEVAREQGYDSTYLANLFNADDAIDQGALLLKKLLLRYGTDTLAAISSYNQGSPRQAHGTFANARYVYRVSVAWRHYDKALHYAELYDKRKENLRLAHRDRNALNDSGRAAAIRMQRTDTASHGYAENDSNTHGLAPFLAGYSVGPRHGSGENNDAGESESLWDAFIDDRFFAIGFLTLTIGMLGLVISIWRYNRRWSGYDQHLRGPGNAIFLSRPKARESRSNFAGTLHTH